MSRKKGDLGERGKITASTIRLTPSLWERLYLVAQVSGSSRAATIENLLWTILPRSDIVSGTAQPPTRATAELAPTRHAEPECGSAAAISEWHPSYRPGEWI